MENFGRRFSWLPSVKEEKHHATQPITCRILPMRHSILKCDECVSIEVFRLYQNLCPTILMMIFPHHFDDAEKRKKKKERQTTNKANNPINNL